MDRPVVQPIYNACVLSGDGLASFPMWGYSLLIRLLGSVEFVVTLQSAIGAIATAALMVRFNFLAPKARYLTTGLFITSLPWLTWQAYAYQMPISSSLSIFMILAAELAISLDCSRWAFVAGVFAGLSQNFRSELIILPSLILIAVWIARKTNQLPSIRLKPLLIIFTVAIAFQIPWGLFCLNHAKRFSLSESNLGHVLVVGLGKLPNNPWMITPSDQFAQDLVTKEGLTCSSLSFEGGEFLKQVFKHSVMQEPYAYGQVLLARLGGTLYYPFGSRRAKMLNEEEGELASMVTRIKGRDYHDSVNSVATKGSHTSSTRLNLLFLLPDP